MPPVSMRFRRRGGRGSLPPLLCSVSFPTGGWESAGTRSQQSRALSAQEDGWVSFHVLKAQAVCLPEGLSPAARFRGWRTVFAYHPAEPQRGADVEPGEVEPSTRRNSGQEPCSVLGEGNQP